MERLKIKRSTSAPTDSAESNPTTKTLRGRKGKHKDKEKEKKKGKKRRSDTQPPPADNNSNGKEKERPGKPPPILHKPPDTSQLPTGKENKSQNAKSYCSINENSKHASLWGTEGEDLPSVFHAWIKLGIPGDSLKYVSRNHFP